MLRTGTIHSGILASANVAAKFSWQRKARTVSLTLIDQVNYRVSSIAANVADDEVAHSCDDSSTSNSIETCTLQLKSIQLDLIDETDLRYFAQLHIDLSATRDNGVSIYDGEIQSQSARLIRLDDAVALQDSEWVGRWTSYRNDVPVTAYDVLADKSWRDGFENGSLGSWSPVNGHTRRQFQMESGVWCAIC